MWVCGHNIIEQVSFIFETSIFPFSILFPQDIIMPYIMQMPISTFKLSLVFNVNCASVLISTIKSSECTGTGAIFPYPFPATSLK
jgi:hypothetical protein